MLKKIISVLILFSVSLTANATYIYEANQSLFNLVNEQNTTNMAASDDGVSSVFNLGFTFTFYGEDFTSARMATNGCLHFKTSGSYCNDYTPDPLPEITYTLYPFWTDLIRDNGSSVLAKNFSDKTVFGWYDLREYHRSSDNSFEVILWKADDSFEFRYGALDIINHDVLIGEQGSSSELYTYLFHDECNTGTTNIAGTCVNTNWNDTSFNTLLENGGSLYGIGSGNALDCTSALNNTACPGYAAAYLTQQCSLDGLYSTQCPTYWDDLFDYECTQNPQSSVSCPGYVVETLVYDPSYEENYDYGYTEEEMWYDQEYDEWLDPNDPCYENACVDFTDADWYELDVEQFGQEQVDEWYGEEVEFSEEGIIDYGSQTEEEYWTVIDEGMEEYDLIEEIYYEEEYITFSYNEEVYEEIYEEVYEEAYAETYEEVYEEVYEEIYEEAYEEVYAYDLEQEYETIDVSEELLLHFEHEQLIEVFEEEPSTFLEFESIEELEEWFEEEEEEIEEERVAEEEEEIEEEGLETEEEDGEKKDKLLDQLNIVEKTIQIATNSISGTTSGTSTHSTATSTASGSTGVVQSSTGGGVSMSNSPSLSTQVASSAAQTQQILTEVVNTTTAGNVGIGTVSTFSTNDTISDNNTAIGNTTTVAASTETTTVETTESGTSMETSVDTTGGPQESNDTEISSTTTVAASNETTTTNDVMNTTVAASSVSVQTQSVETQIETAVADVSSTTDTDQLVAQIVAKNVQVQQEQMEEQQTQTGEYADSSALLAYMAYVPGFSAYRQVNIPDQTMWYQPKAIYGNVSISDNNSAFFGMYSTSLKGITELKQMQPNL